MKKKLEAELISIAHRILKLKNKSEIPQLQAETLKLYEKLSVLRFVEENFSEVKPTIGYASAEGKLEEIYSLYEAEKTELKTTGSEEQAEDVKEQKAPQANGQNTKDSEENDTKDTAQEAAKLPAAETQQEPETEVTEEAEEDTETEPQPEVELERPKEEIKAEEEAVKEVYEKEQDSTPEEEEKAEDAEIKTIEPDKGTEVEKSPFAFELAFERKAAPEEPKQQKEISFEDFHDYKEPEFIRKDETAKEEPKRDEPVKEEPKAEAPKSAEPKAEDVDDWQNWEPKRDEVVKEEPKQEAPKAEPTPDPVPQEQPKPTAPQPAANAGRSLNDSLGKTINLGLNDRIAFEKHLFGGSGEDLNRVLSQLNTFDTMRDARNFINDLVKPDYNNWKDKEEYEERFMGLVEKKFD